MRAEVTYEAEATVNTVSELDEEERWFAEARQDDGDSGAFPHGESMA